MSCHLAVKVAHMKSEGSLMDMDCLYAEYCNGKVKLDLILLADVVIAHWIYVLEGKNWGFSNLPQKRTKSSDCLVITSESS